jgi:hypothetical protein
MSTNLQCHQKLSDLFRFLILAALLTVSLVPQINVQAEEPAPNQPDALTNKIYLPITIHNSPVPNVMLGIYPSSYWQPTVQDAINKEFIPLDAWAGKHTSLAGVYHSIEQYKTVSNMLPTIWNNGYTPFVNIHFNASAASIASGKKDGEIRAWARDFAIYANGGSRMAFLAPMQEMNGDWVPYGLDPSNFKIAFRRVRQLFAEEGVPAASVRWVFAPNGYSDPNYPGFEDYYPGDAYVDVVAFSSYNFGYHPLNPYKDWKTPSETFSPYLTRMTALAPSKPIMIAQTGTTAYYNSSRTTNPDQKNLWLKEAYTLLAQYPGLIGVIYYNASPDYDWTFYRSGSVSFTGYRDGVASANYIYIPPVDVMEMVLSTP